MQLRSKQGGLRRRQFPVATATATALTPQAEFSPVNRRKDPLRFTRQPLVLTANGAPSNTSMYSGSSGPYLAGLSGARREKL